MQRDESNCEREREKKGERAQLPATTLLSLSFSPPPPPPLYGKTARRDPEASLRQTNTTDRRVHIDNQTLPAKSVKKLPTKSWPKVTPIDREFRGETGDMQDTVASVREARENRAATVVIA